MGPQQMLKNYIQAQRASFKRVNNIALTHPERVPIYSEQHLARLFLHELLYQSNVRFFDETNLMEATVYSLQDATTMQSAIISPATYAPPRCCTYSRNGDFTVLL